MARPRTGNCLAVVTFNACFMTAAEAPELLSALSATAGRKVVAFLQEVDAWPAGFISTVGWGDWQVTRGTHTRSPALVLPRETCVGCKTIFESGVSSVEAVTGSCGFLSTYLLARTKSLNDYSLPVWS